MPDANVFVGYNYQHREFTDQSAFESQNWFMLHGTRPVGSGQLQLEGMLSLEPFTMQADRFAATLPDRRVVSEADRSSTASIPTTC